MTPENKTDWSLGDLVIHDADAKTSEMLMRVAAVDAPDGRITTEYINRVGNEPHYLNRKEVLHDPGRFGIDTGAADKPTQYPVCGGIIR